MYDKILRSESVRYFYPVNATPCLDRWMIRPHEDDDINSPPWETFPPGTLIRVRDDAGGHLFALHPIDRPDLILHEGTVLSSEIISPLEALALQAE